VSAGRDTIEHPPTWESPHKWAAVKADKSQPSATEARFKWLTKTRTGTLPFGTSCLHRCQSKLFPSAAHCFAVDKCSKHTEFVSCAELATTTQAQCSQLPVRPQLLGTLNCHHGPGDAGHSCALCEHVASFGNNTSYRLHADSGNASAGTTLGTGVATVKQT